MAGVLYLAGAVIIAATVVMTAMRYGELPASIPVHFGIDGTVNQYGPRVLAWLMPVLQVVLAFTYASISVSQGRIGFLVLGVAMLAVFWRAQMLIFSAAASGQKRVPILGFLIFFTLTLAVGVWGVRL